MTEPQDNEQLRFTTIHYGVLRQLKINANEYLILDMVYHLSIKHGYCYKTVPSIARDLGMTKMGVYKIIERLLIRGYLNRSAAGLTVGEAYVDTAYLHKTPVNKVDRKDISPRKKVNKVYQSKQSTPKNNNIDIQKTLPAKKNLRVTFDKINQALQTSCRFSDSYSKLIDKALKDFTEPELIQAANHFRYKFHGGSQWHTDHQKFYTLKQFLGNDKDNMPRYQTCYEESGHRPVSKQQAIGQYGPNANPDLAKHFPGVVV